MSIFHQLIRGFIGSIGDNEVEIASTMPDPPKVRLAVEEGQVENNLGCVSFNTRRPSGTHDEYGYVMGQRINGGGTVYAATKAPGQENCQQRWFVNHERFISHVPFQAPNLHENKLISTDKRFVLVLQPDGHQVQYDLTLGPEGDPTAAVWSNWHGILKPLPW